jgi:hypothetical protein
MLRPVIDLKIGENKINFVTDCKIASSWKTFTDTAEITLPHKFTKGDRVIFVGSDNIFKKGDPVEIVAGYFPNKTKVFEGYVTGVKPSLPVEIKIEDPAFLLKQTNLTLSFEEVTLKKLLSEMINEAKSKTSGYISEGLSKIKIEAVDASLGAFRITNANAVQVLEELKKTYALTSFFRGHTLFVGLAYNGRGNRVSFEFQKNIISDDLEYLKEDDLSIKVKAISILENNKKIEIEVGDPSGETRTITKYNLSESELKKAAEREIEKLRYEGFRGSFYTFFDPPVFHGDEIELIDKKYPEKNGVYLCESVEREAGVNGYFQNIYLGAKIG